MTDGHAHRHVTVPGYVYRALHRPVLHRSTDRDRVDASRFPYMEVTGWGDEPDEYVLTLLGFLHGTTGLTLVMK